LKPHNLPKQLRILANDLPEWEHPSILDLFNEAYQVDPLPGMILEAIPKKGSLKESTVEECTE